MKHNQIGNRIRELRMRHNMTQAELGKAVGVSMQAVSNWERGGIPDIEILISIARYFGVTMDELLGLVSDSAGQISDTLFSTLLQSSAPNKMELASHYCWSIFKGLSGFSTTRDYAYTTVSIADGDNSRCRVSNNDGISYFVAAQDAQLFAIATEPKEGFASLMGNEEKFVELFRLLSDEDAFHLFLFICSRPQSLISKQLIMRLTNIGEKKVEAVFDDFERRGWVVKETADMDIGAVTLYRTACKESFAFFLLFAREMLLKPRIWHLTSASKRTKPLLSSAEEPDAEPSCGQGKAEKGSR